MAKLTLTTTFTTFSTVEISGSATNFNWLNPSYAGADDSNVTNYWPPSASAWPGSLFNQITDYLECKELLIKLPPTAISIYGIRIGAKGRVADSTGKSGGYEYVEAKDVNVLFYLNSSPISDNKANTVDFWPASSTSFYYYGSLTDSWNISGLTPSLLNDSTFALRLSASFDTVNLDKNTVPFGYQYIQIEISYEDASQVSAASIISSETASNAHKLSALARINTNGIDTTPTNTEITNNTRLMLNIRPGGIPSGQIITNLNKINQNIRPAGQPTGQIITNINKVNQNIKPGGIPSGQIITDLSKINQSIKPGGIPTGQIITDLNKVNQNIRPGGIPSGENTNTTNQIKQNIRPGGIPTGENTTNTNGFNRSIRPGGIPSGENTTNLNKIKQNIRPGGIPSGENTTNNNQIKRSIQPPGIITGEDTDNNSNVKPAAWLINANTTIISQENVSNLHRLRAGNVNIRPTPIETTEDTIQNNFVVNRGTYIFPPGIISQENVSNLHRLRTGNVNILPGGIPTGEIIVGTGNINTLQSIRPSGIISREFLPTTHRLQTGRAYIYPPPIDTTGGTDINPTHKLLQVQNIFPIGIISGEITGLHRLYAQAWILPPGQNTEENVRKHRLRKEDKPVTWQNQIHSPAYEVGYFDCLAISKDLNNDPFYDLSFNALNTNYFFSVSQYDLQFNQPTKMNQRLAGEGASPNTFAVSTLDNTLTLTMPVRVESWGYVDQCFAALYDYCIQGYKGTPTTFVGRLVSPTPLASIGATTFMKIDNIADFKSLGTNFTAYIKSDDDSEATETVTVSSVNKEERRLYFSAATSINHTPSKSYIWAAPTRPVSDREPTFSLFSLREGLFSGCIVDKLSMTLTPGNNITASFTIKFTELDRRYQVNFRDNFNSIMANITKRRPNYLLNSSLLRLYRTTPEVGYFNLGLAEDYKLFRGYQERHFRDFEINEMSLEISNNLQTVYTSNSKNSKDVENLRKNLQPYAYYSNGRTIEGTIKYSSPIKPWLFEEVLSGPGSNNSGGIIYDFGPFKLTLPDVVWARQLSSSSMDQVHQKTVSWSVATHALTFNPYLTPTGVY
jgi:hypothetical protein